MRKLKMPKHRMPYGRRAEAHQRVDEATEYRADWFEGITGFQVRGLPMPRGGGFRWQVQCPACGVWRRALYCPSVTLSHRHARCRKCWHLVYRSQNDRPEASPERIDALFESAKHARYEHTRRRREERAMAALRTFDERQAQFRARQARALSRNRSVSNVLAWMEGDRTPWGGKQRPPAE